MTDSYKGQCHCGAIGFTLHSKIPPPAWSIRACQCSFCLAHDALSTSDPEGRIDFEARSQEHLQKYRFGLKTADFILCRNCGVYIGAVIETGRGRFGIVNVHTLVARPDDIASVAPISYDSEDTSGRVARREDRWTPVGDLP